MILCGGGIGRRKYKFVRIRQQTVGGHARVETTRRKSRTSRRGRKNSETRRIKSVCEVQILTRILLERKDL